MIKCLNVHTKHFILKPKHIYRLSSVCPLVVTAIPVDNNCDNYNFISLEHLGNLLMGTSCSNGIALSSIMVECSTC